MHTLEFLMFWQDRRNNNNNNNNNNRQLDKFIYYLTALKMYNIERRSTFLHVRGMEEENTGFYWDDQRE